MRRVASILVVCMRVYLRPLWTTSSHDFDASSLCQNLEKTIQDLEQKCNQKEENITSLQNVISEMETEKKVSAPVTDFNNSIVAQHSFVRFRACECLSLACVCARTPVSSCAAVFSHVFSSFRLRLRTTHVRSLPRPRFFVA